MSLIKLQGNASGTGAFTIAAPNGNTDRTLTLPDATGTVNVSGLANEVPAGSAGAPAIYPTGDTNTGIFFPAADTIAFAEGGAESMRINSSGNIGVGTSSPTQKFHVAGGNILVNSNTETTIITTGGNFTTGALADSAILYQTGNLLFGVGTTERMRLTSGGTMLVGLSTAYYGERVGVNSAGTNFASYRPDTASLATHLVFVNANGAVGSITTNGSGTAFNTSSDYRLKEDWQPMTGASERVLALKPVNFAWKVDGSRVDGFLAHEAQAVVPEAVAGEKDAVDADGNPQYQGIDQSKLVPLLTAALQEALAEIANLKTRLTALEAN